MLKPSIDTLLDKVPSKYSLVILGSKTCPRIGELVQLPTQEFQSVKSTLACLGRNRIRKCSRFTQIQKQNVKRFVVVSKQNECRKEEEERKIKEQIAKEKEDGEKI